MDQGRAGQAIGAPLASKQLALRVRPVSAVVEPVDGLPGVAQRSLRDGMQGAVYSQ